VPGGSGRLGKWCDCRTSACDVSLQGVGFEGLAIHGFRRSPVSGGDSGTAPDLLLPGSSPF
jgi:hypothetical protein